MITNEGWIKMSERKPTKADRPFWTAYADGLIVVWSEADAMPSDNGWEATHWQPATLPEPPKKELTQRERDGLGFNEWFQEGGHSLGCFPHPVYVWHAALAYRDKQNQEDLLLLESAWKENCDEADSIHSLRRRCGLDQ